MIHKESLATPSIKAGEGVFTCYGSATIHAPAKEVYAALRDYSSYPKWNIYTPQVDGPANTFVLSVGDMITLHYRLEPEGKIGQVPCEIIAISDEELSVCWRGCPKGLPGWALIPEKVQKVTVKGERECFYEIWETQAGPVAWLGKWMLGEKLERVNQRVADGLKEYIESKQSGAT